VNFMRVTDFPELSETIKQAATRAVSAQHEGRLFEADRLYAQMVRQTPLHPLIANAAAGFCLLKGDFAAAWPLFEQRLALPYYTHRPFASLPQPTWTGEDGPGKRLLIFCDLGLGDTILLARFLPWVRERVGSIALQVNPGTSAFWRRRLPDAEINETNDSPPDCDLRINAFCLPRLYRADASNIPGPGYIQSSEDERAFWRDRLGARSGLNVGLNWQGNPDHVRDFERSIPFDYLREIIEDRELRDAGVRFYSLQLHHGRNDVTDLAAAGMIDDLADDMLARDPLEASAALIDELNLLITVDSALANLAGAMDRPFWLPTYKVPDWRWRVYPTADLAEPAAAPWYGAETLFTCEERQDWTPVMAAMLAALRERATAS
jgi:hypothetical protein